VALFLHNVPMLVFIDESGDPGLKLTTGSSKFFTIVLVVFGENDDALACDQRISLLRKELNLPEDYEFHFKEKIIQDFRRKKFEHQPKKSHRLSLIEGIVIK
jgi:hypothetical protein